MPDERMDLPMTARFHSITSIEAQRSLLKLHDHAYDGSARVGSPPMSGRVSSLPMVGADQIVSEPDGKGCH